MCRYPASSALRTASRVSSGGVWKTPRPRAGISTPLFSFRAGTVVAAIGRTSFRVEVVGRLVGRRMQLVLVGLAGHGQRVGHSRCCRPAGEQVERLLGRRAGLGGEDGDAQVVGAELHRLVDEVELTDDGMVDALGTGAVEAHVVRRPADAELVA